MYLEYASHGNLLNVTQRYLLKHKYLPELFIWSVFEMLAETADLMRRCPGQWQPLFQDQPGNLNRNGQDPNKFILALDVKPENILIFDRSEVLGAAHPRLPRLPVVKLADFGLTKVFGPMMPVQHQALQAGTDGYIPPEIPPFTNPNFVGPRTGDHWNQPIYPHQGLAVDETHNVWVIGKVMLDMMAHFPRDTCGIYWSKLQEANYRFGPPGLRDHFMPEIHLVQTAAGTIRYPAALRNLIRECVSMEAYQRPGSANLLTRVRAGRTACINAIRNRRGSAVRQEDRLALTIAAFNKVPQARDIDVARPSGWWAFDPQANGHHWWNTFIGQRANKSLDPDAPLLNLHRTMYQRFYHAERLMYGGSPGRHDWQQAGGMAEVRRKPWEGS